MDHLRSTGALVERIDRDRLHWTAATRVSDLLNTLRQNAFSHMWHLAADVHRDLYCELERRLQTLRVAPAEVEEAPAHLAVWRVRWPEHAGEET